ncbi:hypothetical protein [Chitinimonas lacunae]|uniref:CopG family transcriptional regulator n=1 Tax=Chitinimonas lacunae TaxID=1963018 RepID=A0ABV8MY61_9NEIS
MAEETKKAARPPLPLGNRTKEEKLAALAKGAEFVEAALERAGEHATPWALADPKARIAFPLRIPGPLASKLEYVYLNLPKRPSKNAIILAALEAWLDTRIAEIGTPTSRELARLKEAEQEGEK